MTTVDGRSGAEGVFRKRITVKEGTLFEDYDLQFYRSNNRRV